MIPAQRLGELRDRAAGLVALAELLSSRRIGPKAIAAAIPSAGEACAGVVAAASALAPDVIATAAADREAADEIQAAYDRAVTSVHALEADLRQNGGAPEAARTRLVLERAAHAASSHVSAALFIAEMFMAASSPRTVSIRVVDVLAFGPALSDGPQVVRATLDAQPGPVATTDARLLRALVELGVQIVSTAGTQHPHVEVIGGAGGGARILIGERTRPSAPPPAPRRPPRSDRPDVAQLAVRRLPWSAAAIKLARAAAAMAGACVTPHPGGRSLTLVFS